MIAKLNETGDRDTTGEEDAITILDEGITLAIKFKVKPELVYST